MNRIFLSGDRNKLSCPVLMRNPVLPMLKILSSVIVFGNMIHELPCEDLKTFFCRLRYPTLDHLKGLSFQQWVSIHESIQPPPLQKTCRSIWPIQSSIDIVSFQQYHVSGHWISLTLHPNYPINQVIIHFKIQNRISSRALFSDVLPLSQCPPSNRSSREVG